MLSVFVWVLLCLYVTPLSAGSHYIHVEFPTTKCAPPKGPYCVKIRQCPFFDDLLNRTSKPRPRSVIKIIREYQCDFDGNTPYVCCETQTSPLKTTIETTTTSRPSIDINSLAKVLRSHRNIGLLPNDVCGQIATNSRIISGTKTGIGEFPWMALLAYYKDDVLDFRCGGTLINERYVLTAGHCIIHSQIVGVRLGEHNLESIVDCDEDNNCAPRPQDFYIENIIVHPEYDSKTYANDIALIRLATSANFSASNVKPICLPMGEMELSGRQAIVTGWGVTENGNKSNELLKVSLPVLPISKCQTMYKRFAQITSNQICAGGYNGKDSCAGDSGGPMQYAGVISGSPKFIQYGIVSYGPRYCGIGGHPSIYTKVPSYMKWILDNMLPFSDD